ncbi:MAG: LytTR family DNA-binding domain-containing protein [Flavitalea sp.]
MKCIIIDDEKLALDLLQNNIARIPYLDLVKRFKNAFDAITYLRENTVDLIFLDIQMPGISGLEFLQSLNERPMAIIVSAYDHYAIEGFNLDVTDYLIKPVSFERFLKACNKSYELHQHKNSFPGLQESERKYFFVNVEYRQVKIDFENILFIEAMRDYARIHIHEQKPVITHVSMKALEERVARQPFSRVHKSYIVNIARISSIKRGSIMVGSHEVPLSENYKDALNKKLGISTEAMS